MPTVKRNLIEISKHEAKPSEEMVKIWEEKNKLIKQIKKKHNIDITSAGFCINDLKDILKNGIKESNSERESLDLINKIFS